MHHESVFLWKYSPLQSERDLLACSRPGARPAPPPQLIVTDHVVYYHMPMGSGRSGKAKKQKETAANPFSVKKVAKATRVSKKTRNRKKCTLEAVDREFSSLCRNPVQQGTGAESSGPGVALPIKAIATGSSMSDIVKLTELSSISPAP